MSTLLTWVCIIGGYLLSALLAGRMSYIYYDAASTDPDKELTDDEFSKMALSMLFGPVAAPVWFLFFLMNWMIDLVMLKPTRHKKALIREKQAIEAKRVAEQESVELNKIIKESGLDRLADVSGDGSDSNRVRSGRRS